MIDESRIVKLPSWLFYTLVITSPIRFLIALIATIFERIIPWL